MKEEDLKNYLQEYVDKWIEENKEEWLKSWADFQAIGTSVVKIDADGNLLRVDPTNVKMEEFMRIHLTAALQGGKILINKEDTR